MFYYYDKVNVNHELAPSVRTFPPRFTLVELSLVLVIIGLIVGGVMVARI